MEACKELLEACDVHSLNEKPPITLFLLYVDLSLFTSLFVGLYWSKGAVLVRCVQKPSELLMVGSQPDHEVKPKPWPLPSCFCLSRYILVACSFVHL